LILAGFPGVFTEVFNGFHQSCKANAGIVLK